MELLILGLVLFLGLHLLPTFPGLRAAAVARLGANGYKLAFSVAAIAAFAVLVVGYARAERVLLWMPPGGMRPLVIALMLVAFVMLVAAYVPSNLKRIVPHPFLLAVILWAAAHLLVRGDVASLLLFGSFLAYAIYDWWSAERRGARKPGGRHARWRDALVVGIGIFLYLGMVHFHPVLIGVPVW